MLRLLVPFTLCLLSAAARADEVDDLVRDLKTPAKARAAWDKLVEAGPPALPRLLQALDTPDTATANWLRTAFDRIVESAERNKQPLGLDALHTFAKDQKRQGRARRLALEVVEKHRPGSRAALLREALNDAEFGYDAIELAMEELAKKPSSKEVALKSYRDLYAASRDQDQGRKLAAELKKLGVTVSLAEHMGFIRHWHVVGPFDANVMKGFTTAYPPEKGVDLKATYEGKDGKKLTWKAFEAPETWSGRHQALVSLPAALGDADDAVGYAFATLRVDKAGPVEFRGSADDNFTVWVNGERVFGFEEYRNGVRLDRHRFIVNLKAGDNSILVKICQSKSEDGNREPNWEFFLRLCDPTGKGIAYTQRR